MERLTIKYGDGLYESINPVDIFDNEYSKANYDKLVKRLGEYEDLEEQGKLLKLPCAVGDTVWDNDFGKPCSYTVTGFSIGKIDDEENDIDELEIYYRNWCGSICCSCVVSEIGKSVFLTKEEAEAALKE